MSLNKKTVKYYLVDQEVGSIEVETDEVFLHRKYGWPPIEKIDSVSILDLISKLIDRIQEMQHQIETNSKEIQNMNRGVKSEEMAKARDRQKTQQKSVQQ